jgi:transcriptional regulator with XRE-family HTH domain
VRPPPGLRREELAALAGVSVDYYVRLEQGRAAHVSEAVLDAVARALRLDADEREHLLRLAHPPRFDAGRHPGDPALAALVGELSVASGLFRRLWAEHPVAAKGHSVAVLDHPIAGRLELAYETLQLPDGADQVLVTYTAAPSSPRSRGIARSRVPAGRNQPSSRRTIFMMVSSCGPPWIG